MKTTLNEETLDLLWLGSFRYYCGRMTISAHAFCDALIANIDQLPPYTLSIIKRDLLEKFGDDDRSRLRHPREENQPLGHDADRQKWLDVLAAIAIPVNY